MAPMLRINISIPSDLYEECQQACEKQKISFSQMVRSALINYIHGGSAIQPYKSEEEVSKIVEQVLSSHLTALQERMTDMEKNIYALQKIPLKSEDHAPKNKIDGRD